MTVESETTPQTKMGGGWQPTRIIRAKSTTTWVIAAIVALLVILVAYTVLTSPAMEWSVIVSYMFAPRILAGLWTTIYLTFLAMAIGITAGLIAAVLMRSRNPILFAIGSGYVWIFRAVPTLVQLLIWYNLASLFPMVNIGIPFMDPWLSVSPNAFMTPLLAACLGLGLSEGAYMAEIIRGGILSVPKGQSEAASALGMSARLTLFRIVLPQAMRAIIPATGNQVIGMLKYTSLASVISVAELLQSAQQIYNVNFRIIPLLMVASFWYIILTSLLTIGQRFIERYFARGFDSRQGVAASTDIPPATTEEIQQVLAEEAESKQAERSSK